MGGSRLGEGRIVNEGVGRKLRAHREDLGLTRAKLAKQLGVSPSTIAHVESGRRGLSVVMLCTFAAGLELAPCCLLPGDVCQPSASLESMRSDIDLWEFIERCRQGISA